MQGKGIESIVELRVTDRKASVKEFTAGWGPASTIEKEIIIPQISYLTNDSWEIISALDDTNGWPILHAADFSKGKFYVLTIPDNFVDLYILPEPVLNRLRQIIAGDLPVSIEASGEVSLFAYDNNSFVVESFLDKEVTIKVLLDKNVKQITNVVTGETTKGIVRMAPAFRNRKFGKDASIFEVTLKPHSFKGFRF